MRRENKKAKLDLLQQPTTIQQKHKTKKLRAKFLKIVDKHFPKMSPLVLWNLKIVPTCTLVLQQIKNKSIILL